VISGQAVVGTSGHTTSRLHTSVDGTASYRYSLGVRPSALICSLVAYW